LARLWHRATGFTLLGAALVSLPVTSERDPAEAVIGISYVVAAAALSSLSAPRKARGDQEHARRNIRSLVRSTSGNASGFSYSSAFVHFTRRRSFLLVSFDAMPPMSGPARALVGFLVLRALRPGRNQFVRIAGRAPRIQLSDCARGLRINLARSLGRRLLIGWLIALSVGSPDCFSPSMGPSFGSGDFSPSERARFYFVGRIAFRPPERGVKPDEILFRRSTLERGGCGLKGYAVHSFHYRARHLHCERSGSRTAGREGRHTRLRHSAARSKITIAASGRRSLGW